MFLRLQASTASLATSRLCLIAFIQIDPDSATVVRSLYQFNLSRGTFLCPFPLRWFEVRASAATCRVCRRRCHPMQPDFDLPELRLPLCQELTLPCAPAPAPAAALQCCRLGDIAPCSWLPLEPDPQALFASLLTWSSCLEILGKSEASATNS